MQHELSERQQRARRGCCHDCAAAYECARRGYGAPAPGYVSASDAAARLCLTPKAVRHRCLAGQMPGAVQRGGRFGKWWIPEEALR